MLNYNNAQMRRWLKAFFEDEEDFDFFCEDQYPDVYAQFTDNFSFNRKARLVTQYCEDNDLYPQFIALIKNENPARFQTVPPPDPIETFDAREVQPVDQLPVTADVSLVEKPKKINSLIIYFVIIVLIANLPLLRVILLHDSSTAITIIGHAPEQFLFLTLFFPAAVFLTLKLMKHTIDLQTRYPAIRQTSFWQWFVGRKIIFISSILICLTVATVDHIWTTPDFYQRTAEDARQGAILNKEVITSLSHATSKDEQVIIKSDPDFQKKVERLQQIYNNPNNFDLLLRRFEFLELSVVGFTVSLAMWMLYLNLKLLGLAQQSDNLQLRENLRQEIKEAIPTGVLIVIAYLFWPPLRSYNIFEVQQVITIQTLNPLNIYGIVALAASALIWLHYSKFGSNLLSTALAVISFLASGALMGIARFTPDSLVDYVGSGMGFGNLFFIILVVVLFYIFSTEIFRQLTGGLEP